MISLRLVQFDEWAYSGFLDLFNIFNMWVYMAKENGTLYVISYWLDQRKNNRNNMQLK